MAKARRLALIIARCRGRMEQVLNPSGPEDLSCLCTAQPRVR